MTYQNITKAAVDTAEPLTFPDRKPKADLTITVHCRIDQFDTEVCFTGSVDQLLNITRRLREIGAEPVSAAQTTPAATSNGKAKTAPPEFNDAGEELCPTHHRKLRGPNQWGKLFCSAKDDAGEYCKYTWKPE